VVENSGIEWTRHTFNPWLGCTKVSPPCDNCYAEKWAMRFPGNRMLWSGERRRTSAAYWREPLKWNRKASDAGERHRVFCASLADVFDNQAAPDWRRDLFDLIHRTPDLDWMLLTKRPQNIAKMLPKAPVGPLDVKGWGDGWANVWIGTSVGVRADLRNIDHLRRVPARIRFLSCEPLLEDLGELDFRGIHLVIAGGESGPNARPMHPDWVRRLRGQCVAEGVPFFFKQWGEWTDMDHAGIGSDGPVATAKGNVRDWLRRHSRFIDGTERILEAYTWTGHGTDLMYRVGKKAAGAMLDGREWREMPV
jgi:protein gp37